MVLSYLINQSEYFEITVSGWIKEKLLQNSCYKGTEWIVNTVLEGVWESIWHDTY